MASLGPFYRPVEEAPPWDWNPGATFMRAYNDAQENKRLNEKMAMEQELNSILFPLKEQQAQLQLEKLQQEVERGTLLTQKIREAGRTAHQGIMQGIKNPGGADSQNQTAPNSFMIDTTGLNLKTTTSRAPSSPGRVKLPE